MQYYPVFMDIKDQPCLVVGGGSIALRKIRLQLKAGAKITVIAPELCSELREEFGTQIGHLARRFEDTDIEGYRLITAATDQSAVNQRISHLAQAKNIPVNVVDEPELCSFITPAIVERPPMTIGISTGGAAPVLARKVRSLIETTIPAGYGRLAAAMNQTRDALKDKLPDEQQRRAFWEDVVDGSIAQHFIAGREREGLDELNAALNSGAPQTRKIGEVSLVGAGPGDPDLLTFRALRLMQQADVVLHDRLVSQDIIDLCRRDADRIYVGKQRSNHSVPQAQINQLLVDLAQQGKNVVRLKGGDPFIFGRGGEEIELLSKNGIPFQIVPGITAASGCAAYAGIPLTHRDHAQACLFVTGHLKNGSVDLDWSKLASQNQTTVIYMGLMGLPVICEKLIEHQLPATTPIALVEQGTTENQRVFTGTLASLPAKVDKEDVHAPTLIIPARIENPGWFRSGTKKASLNEAFFVCT
jgi:uroporphyrin-III C-methyltransferase/precorrin-2 dehydrogenase/sirohydrochlorin ferrochelatase